MRGPPEGWQHDRFGNTLHPERREYAGNIPAGRLGRPEEVAAVAVLLCSTEAAYMTGEIVDVNGGFHID